jgi:hypothetical protein
MKEGREPFFSFMLLSVTTWLESHMGACSFKQLTGVDCPGCGSQRAFILLLKGRIWESICMYPALIPIIIMLLALVLHLVFKFRNGADFLKYNFITVMALITLGYIIKMST